MIYSACHIMPWHDYNEALVERGSMILDPWKEGRNEKRQQE
ncbi:MAG: hypothetical protein QW508_02005 [Conexivisphaerales archaeon]